MGKILVVDDDEALRRLVRLNLKDTYEIIDTGVPEEALALAMEHKPDAILLDLRMPHYSGFELCQMLTSFSRTQLIPILIVSGEAGAQTKEFCRDLGAAGYFEKPVDFEALKACLARTVATKRVERRSEVRVRLRVPLRLSGTDAQGKAFEAVTNTENVGLNSFLCGCPAVLQKDSLVSVYLASGSEEYVGKARVVRSEAEDTPLPRYGMRFVEKVGRWVLQ
ncbi:MAG: response regulator [Acidobacteriia bacterium]|nr:response regulator [Terriglobia bacterium]